MRNGQLSGIVARYRYVSISFVAGPAMTKQPVYNPVGLAEARIDVLQSSTRQHLLAAIVACNPDKSEAKQVAVVAFSDIG